MGVKGIAIFAAIGSAACIWLMPRAFENTSWTEKLNAESSLDSSGIIGRLKGELQSDQFKSLNVGIHQTPVSKQFSEWQFSESKLGNFRSLAQDTASRLFNQTLSKIKSDKRLESSFDKLLDIL